MDRRRSRSRERDERRSGKEKERERSRDRDRDGRRPPAPQRLASPARRQRTDHSRSRSPSRSPPSRHNNKSKRRHSRSRSRSRDSASSDDDRRRRKDKGKDRHKEKRRKRSREESRSRSRSRERRERKKEKKREKKEKKKHSAVTAQWGKYGLITEADMYTKEQEFHLWLLEERQVNPETLTKPSQKKLFQSYMEDYNTATLPHEKYYALEAYERRMNLIRSGGTLPLDDGGYDPKKDMDAHSKSIKKSAATTDGSESYLSREQLMELRKVQQERIQVGKMKQLGLEIKGSMGVRMDGNEFE